MWNKCRKTLQNRIEIHVKEIKYEIRLTMMMLHDKIKQNKIQTNLKFQAIDIEYQQLVVVEKENKCIAWSYKTSAWW